MNSTHKLNGVQILGIILSLTGLIFIAFPSVVGIFAVRIITFLFLVLGLYGLIFGFLMKSRMTLLTSISILIVGFLAFSNPDSVLFFLGVACLISGVNSLLLFVKTFKTTDERTIISSILLILLGVFAIVNSKAALSTVVLILGIIIVILGLIVFFIGNKFKLQKQNYHTYTHMRSSADPFSSKVIVEIHSDDVEEIEYKEV